ncbi:hypothetical protein Droror1_Dr00025722 [Drosera rotundifolia]
MRGMKCSSLSDMVERVIGVEKGLRLHKSVSSKRPRETLPSGQGRKGDWKRRPTQAPTQAQTQARAPSGVFRESAKPCKKCHVPHSFEVRCDSRPFTCFTPGEKGHKSYQCLTGKDEGARSRQASHGMWRKYGSRRAMARNPRSLKLGDSTIRAGFDQIDEMEILLEVVCSLLDSSVAELEKNAYPVLDGLARNVSTKNLEGATTQRETEMVLQQVMEQLQKLVNF